jgi:hypothetical protein
MTKKPKTDNETQTISIHGDLNELMRPAQKETQTTQDTQTMTDQLTPHQALARAIADCGNVKASKFNSHFKSKYMVLSDLLDAVKPVMASYGLAILQIPNTTDGRISIKTQIVHGFTGHIFDFGELGIKSDGLNMQQIGSCMTYLRRFSISTITGVASETEDDDGNAGSMRHVSNHRPAQSGMTTNATPNQQSWHAAMGLNTTEKKMAAIRLLKAKGWLRGDTLALDELPEDKVHELTQPRMMATFIDAVRAEVDRLSS